MDTGRTGSGDARAARMARGTRLLSATLVASAAAGCLAVGNAPAPGLPVLPSTLPPADSACTDGQKADPTVDHCCVVVTKPETQRACTTADIQVTNRCCPQ